ncbi:hypothetical protein ON010_g12186 [Phytophthora cinnamomi]|nr:hypothetical protein ON010_g12186 [Phytophthora cinnamomi]
MRGRKQRSAKAFGQTRGARLRHVAHAPETLSGIDSRAACGEKLRTAGCGAAAAMRSPHASRAGPTRGWQRPVTLAHPGGMTAAAAGAAKEIGPLQLRHMVAPCCMLAKATMDCMALNRAIGISIARVNNADCIESNGKETQCLYWYLFETHANVMKVSWSTIDLQSLGPPSPALVRTCTCRLLYNVRRHLFDLTHLPNVEISVGRRRPHNRPHDAALPHGPWVFSLSIELLASRVSTRATFKSFAAAEQNCCLRSQHSWTKST